ncbi:hypothetical protein KHQ82_06345 [Mycoplasmatota bacterium]|nr:hypothetical protein KHQ82_06345 [Mycoplasmatota bacterium]
MGKYVHTILDGKQGYNVIAGIDKKRDYCRVEVYPKIEEVLEKKDVDLIIDFSSSSSKSSIEYAIKSNIPVLSGTTGFTDSEKNELIALAKSNNSNLMLISNFAHGASVMYKIVKDLANDFDKHDIIEVHHVNKRDKPSGTAKEYAKIMKVDVDKVQSIRLNDVIASHEAIFDNPGEKLIIRHEIYHRDAFLKGLNNSLDIILHRRVWISDLDQYNRIS